MFLLGGIVAGGRFLYFFFTVEGQTGHTQSLILAAILILVAFILAVFGKIADLVGAYRKLLEGILRRVRKLETRTDRHGTDPPTPEQ